MYLKWKVDPPRKHFKISNFLATHAKYQEYWLLPSAINPFMLKYDIELYYARCGQFSDQADLY